MSTCILPYSRFLHIPKTGGTWVKNAIELAGIPCVVDPRYAEHANYYDSVGKRQFTFTFVRHPLSWWRSYWMYRVTHAWVDGLKIDDNCRSDDFNEFIKQVVSIFPGHCHEVFSAYVGIEDGLVQFVGKQENLVEDLILALTQAGEVFDPDRIRSMPIMNESSVALKERARYTEANFNAILSAEYEVLARYGYGEYEEHHLRSMCLG